MIRYETSVFINCPFDEKFRPLFHAIVLTVAAFGFTPRCAREREQWPGQGHRDSNIAELLLECKYSIHDLSRFKGEGKFKLARFNMPFELGVAYGIHQVGKLEGRLSQREHQWLALVPPKFVHQKFISDLSGYDLPEHDETAAKVIEITAKWLKGIEGSIPGCSARIVHQSLPEFQRLFAGAATAALSPGSVTWAEVIAIAEAVVTGMPTPPLP